MNHSAPCPTRRGRRSVHPLLAHDDRSAYIRKVQHAEAGRWSVSRAAGGTCSTSMAAHLQALVHSPPGRWSLQDHPTDERRSVQTSFWRRAINGIAEGAACRTNRAGRWTVQEVRTQPAEINTRLDSAAAVSLPCFIPSFSLSADEHEPRFGSAEMDGTAEAVPNPHFPSPSARASRALRRTSQWHRPARPMRCGFKKDRGMVPERPDIEPRRTIATVARRDEQAACFIAKRASLAAAERSPSWTKAAPRMASTAHLERRSVDYFRASGSRCTSLLSEPAAHAARPVGLDHSSAETKPAGKPPPCPIAARRVR